MVVVGLEDNILLGQPGRRRARHADQAQARLLVPYSPLATRDYLLQATFGCGLGIAVEVGVEVRKYTKHIVERVALAENRSPGA